MRFSTRCSSPLCRPWGLALNSRARSSRSGSISYMRGENALWGKDGTLRMRHRRPDRRRAAGTPGRLIDARFHVLEDLVPLLLHLGAHLGLEHAALEEVGGRGKAEIGDDLLVRDLERLPVRMAVGI